MYEFIILQKPGGVVALLDEAWYAHFVPLYDIPYVYLYSEKEMAD